MSSSTSSFKTELKVVALVVILLAGSELAVRSREQALSLDVRHIRQIPAISQEMTEGEGLRVLFLGNSMTRYGVEPGAVEGELRARGFDAPLRIVRVYPDATGLTDWYYAFNHYFVDAGRPPDVLIVGFASNDLTDARPLQPWRLAQYYTAAHDVPEVFAWDVRDFDGRVDFLLSDVSSSFANRRRVRERMLDLFVPYYRESAQQINRAQQAKDKRSAASLPAPTYGRLGRLGRLASNHGVRVVLVAMPQRESYDLDPQLRTATERAGMTLIDARSVDGLGREGFVDEMHLNSGGAMLYSRFLARQLAPPLREAFEAKVKHTSPAGE